jgi:hypothetical protein
MEEATDRNDFGHRLEGDEGDEIGRVALAYNQMLDSVERQIGKRPASQGWMTATALSPGSKAAGRPPGSAAG